MAKAPGFFRFVEVNGPAQSVPLCSWALVNTNGDVVAVSYNSMGAKTAKDTAQWIIDNAAGFEMGEDPTNPRFHTH